jgi:hypothetical protein
MKKHVERKTIYDETPFSYVAKHCAEETFPHTNRT